MSKGSLLTVDGCRGKSKSELFGLLKEKRCELLSLRFDRLSLEKSDFCKFKRFRKEIARIMTVISERKNDISNVKGD